MCFMFLCVSKKTIETHLSQSHPFLLSANEYFDLETNNEIPRVLALLFKNT
jgi:hypothetical protein